MLNASNAKEAIEQENVSDGREPMDVPNIRFSIESKNSNVFSTHISSYLATRILLIKTTTSQQKICNLLSFGSQ